MKQRERLNSSDFPGLVWPLRLTRLGLWAGCLWRAFWPLFSWVFGLTALILFGALRWGDVAILGYGTGLAALVLAYFLWRGIVRFQRPRQKDAIALIDATLPGQPLQTLNDELALGNADQGSLILWRAHLARLAKAAQQARAVVALPRLAASDPLGMRLLAVVALVMAVVFGPSLRPDGSVLPGSGASADISGGPTWEGWLEPPAYTGKPTLYLGDLSQDPLGVPVGSQITLRFYGDLAQEVAQEAVTGDAVVTLSGAQHSFRLNQSGTVTVLGQGGRSWQFVGQEDIVPSVAVVGEFEARISGEWRQPFQASDDYGVQSGFAQLELDLDRVDRRFGLAIPPEPRAAITLDLPFPYSGDRREIEGILEEQLAKHPWAGLPVRLQLGAQDAARQVGYSPSEPIVVPERRFFDGLANSIVEQRRDLLWSRENATRVAQILRAVSYQPEQDFELQTDYLRLRAIVRRLERMSAAGRLTPELQDELAELLWQLAVRQEEGELADAKQRVERAQDRLEEAMRDGATDQEIAELMQELREAMRDYVDQLAQQSQQDGSQENQGQDQNPESQEITNEQMNQLLERLQELMEQGRMAEAEQLLEQLRQMLENMEVTQGEQGQEGGEGEAALEGLADTLEDQQRLSDDTFSDLQRQFGEGEEPGQQGQPGEDGQEGQGGENGQDGPGGQQGRRGENGQLGSEEGPGRGFGDQRGTERGQSLADRQQALRDLLQGQSENMPGQRGGDGQGVRRSLDEAGRAMDDAEDALRDGDLGGALEDQAEAMEALREGMRDLAEALRNDRNEGSQGQAAGDNASDDRQDPLGRRPGNGGQVATDEQLLQGQDVYRRAEEILDELRRRSGDQDRSAEEKRYLERLLRQF